MSQTTTLQTEWMQMCQQLQEQLKDRSVMRWLGRVIPELADNNLLQLWAPSPCIRELIEMRYHEAIRSLWRQKNGGDVVLALRSQMPVETVAKEKPLIIQMKENSAPKTVSKLIEGSDEDPYVQFLDKTHTFDTFVVGEANRFAYEAARHIAEEDTVSFNPLYFHADVGLGKTHLMHAIAWRIKERCPDKVVWYLSSEQFTQRYIHATQSHDMISFKAMFNNVDVLLMDDIQFIVGKKQTQEEFLQTFNNLIARGKKIILSANVSPMEMCGLEARLQTRIAQGLVVDIHPASYDLRLGILHTKLKQMGTHLDEAVLSFLADSITSNVRELEGALKRLVAHRQLLGGEITPDTARQILKDILQTRERSVKAADIQQGVADYYRLSLKDLRSTRRDRAIARPRQMAMYLTKMMTPMALPDIAAFYERDHTTIMHAVKTIENLLTRDKQLMCDRDTIIENLRRSK